IVDKKLPSGRDERVSVVRRDLVNQHTDALRSEEMPVASQSAAPATLPYLDRAVRREGGEAALRACSGNQRALHMIALFLGAAAFVAAAAMPVAQANTITVNNLVDGTSGPNCTLRDAITAANNNTAVGGCQRVRPGWTRSSSTCPSAAISFSAAAC
ncbi:MAG: hypothetical protein ABI648_17550, partial [Betaproteobacteria bacterium]